MKPTWLRRSLASASGARPVAILPATLSVPWVGVRMQPRIDSSVVLPLPEGPISSVSSPVLSARLTPLSARTLPAPWPRSLTMSRASSTTDVPARRGRGRGRCFLYGCDSGHRLNTMAGSMRMTLPIAESAEIAHMTKVRASSSAARPGDMTIGKAVCSLR